MNLYHIAMIVGLTFAWIGHHYWKRSVIEQKRRAADLRRETRNALKRTSGQRLLELRRQNEDERFRNLVADVWPETRKDGEVLPTRERKSA